MAIVRGVAASMKNTREGNLRAKKPFRPGTTRRNRSGGVIRQLRASRDWAQNDLAARLQCAGWDISRENLAQVESGRRAVTDHEVALLCRVFRVTAGQLLGLERIPSALLSKKGARKRLKK